MQANELRVGNWIESNSKYVQFNYSSYPMGNEINRVIYFYSNKKGHDGEHNNLANLIPIPLTSEILLKCGFEIENSYSMKISIVDNDYLLYDYRQSIILIIEKNPGAEFKIIFCPYNQTIYLHQLQNLYFALIGKELNINL